jgi:hypothetical protein
VPLGGVPLGWVPLGGVPLGLPPVMFPPGPPFPFSPGLAVMFPSWPAGFSAAGAPVMLTAGVPAGTLAGVTALLSDTTAGLVVVTAVAGVVVEDELVHPVTITIPKTSTAIVAAIPSFRTELLFVNKEIALIRIHLWYGIIRK